MNEKISVIVPIYKVEQVLKRCVDSILSQTYENLEIILVDDGSPDQCPAICDAYVRQDARIKVVHKKNGGLTSAWKEGVRHAEGEWLGFVDSDDWIEPDMYEQLYEPLKAQQADMSMAGLVFDYEDPNYPPRKEGNRLTKEYYSAKEWQELFPVLINDGSFIGRTIQPSRVTKLFRRELVEQNLDLWDDRVTVGEDLQMVFAAAIDAKGVCVVNDYYPYHYWYNMSSMTGQYDARYLEKIKLLRERMEAISDAKKGYDFRPQIRNDFLSLAIMAVKNEIWRNHRDPFFTVLQKTKEMCRDKAVQEALNNHTMDRLGLSVQVYIFMMKHGLAFPCYVVTKLFFTLYYGVFSHVQ